MTGIASTPTPPYYAVIFTFQRTETDAAGYEQTANRMLALAPQQPGFLGVETVRDHDGLGVTVSYWLNVKAIEPWRKHAEHQMAQANGKEKWYAKYRLRICCVESDYGFEKQASIT